jgi:hypothetical protein
MSTIKAFRDELNNLLKNKELTKEILNKPDDPNSIKMDFKYQRQLLSNIIFL